MIIDLTKTMLILQDKVMGETQIFLDDIYEDSISRYVGEWKHE